MEKTSEVSGMEESCGSEWHRGVHRMKESRGGE